MSKVKNTIKRLKRNDLKVADDENDNACMKNNNYNFKQRINFIKKRIFCPRTYKYEKKILNDYYLKFDYQNHFLNQKLLLKHLEITESDQNESNEIIMYKKQEKNKNSTESRYTYDNATYMHSPKSKSKQKFKISSSTTPFVNSFINRNESQSKFRISSSSTPFLKVSQSIHTGNIVTTTFDKSIISNQGINNNNDVSFIDRNLPTSELDLKIKEKFFQIKCIYPKSMYMTQLLMVESMYNVKTSNIKYELKEALQQFDELNSESSEVNYKRVSRAPKRSNSINNIAHAICSCSKFRRKSASRIATSSTEYLNKNFITLPISATSLNNINDLIQHKNYFKLERENLEMRYESMIKTLQSEILARINELQLKVKVEHKLLSYERTKMMEKMKEREIEQQYLQRKQIMSAESSIERKIRKRQRTICSSYSVNNKAFNQVNTNNQQLNAIRFYRNINVTETSV